ncbi:hypothetical protein QF026_007292 [Streptomyces aurantiacus]|nr:hypothetical protein [Streptomyces aurantiacus]
MTPYDPISQVTAYDDPLGPGGPARPHDPDGGSRGPAGGPRGAAAGRLCFEGAR